ncbi:MAG: hypothetical protein ACRDT8_17265 [Micromonosporaceae bacterium]
MPSLPEFLPGVQLCRQCYADAVRPVLDRTFPGLPHTAARIGPGSDVLGHAGRSARVRPEGGG